MAFLAATQEGITNPVINKYSFLTHKVLHHGIASYRLERELGHLTLPGDMMSRESRVLDYNCFLKEDEIGKNEYYAEDERGYSDMLCMLESKKFRIDFPEEGAILMLCLAKKNKLKDFEEQIYSKIKPLFGAIRFFPRESESVVVTNEIPMKDLNLSMDSFEKAVDKVANGKGELGIEIKWNRMLAPLYMELCKMFCKIVCSGVTERDKKSEGDFLNEVKNTMESESGLCKKLLCKRSKGGRNSGMQMMYDIMWKYCNGDEGDANGSLKSKAKEVTPILAKMLRKYDPQLGDVKQEKDPESGTEEKKKQHRENSVKRADETLEMYCERFLSRVGHMELSREKKQGMKRETFDELMSVSNKIKRTVPDWKYKGEGIHHDVFMCVLDDTNLSEEHRAFCYHEFQDSFLIDPKNTKSPSLEALVRPVSTMIQNAKRARSSCVDVDLLLVNSLIEKSFQMNCRSLCLTKASKQLHYRDFPYYFSTSVGASVASNLLSHGVNASVLKDVMCMILNVQADAFMPNPLVECINSLFEGTGYSWNGWKTIASDIFEGSFSQNYATAASKAAKVLYQTLYSEHFKLDADYEAITEFVSQNGKLSTDLFNKLLKRRVFKEESFSTRYEDARRRCCEFWNPHPCEFWIPYSLLILMSGAHIEECANYLGGSSTLALFIALEEIESVKSDKRSILCHGVEHCVKHICRPSPMLKYAISHTWKKAKRQAISNALLYVSLAFKTKEESLVHLRHMHELEFNRVEGERTLQMTCCEHFESVFGRRTIEYEFDGRNMFS